MQRYIKFMGKFFEGTTFHCIRRRGRSAQLHNAHALGFSCVCHSSVMIIFMLALVHGDGNDNSDAFYYTKRNHFLSSWGIPGGFSLSFS